MGPNKEKSVTDESINKYLNESGTVFEEDSQESGQQQPQETQNYGFIRKALKRKRVEEGISQVYMATQLEVSESTIQRFENESKEKNKPDFGFVINYMRILKMPIGKTIDEWIEEGNL